MVLKACCSCMQNRPIDHEQAILNPLMRAPSNFDKTEDSDKQRRFAFSKKPFEKGSETLFMSNLSLMFP